MEKLAYSLAEAAAASGMSTSMLQRQINTGALRAKRSSADRDGRLTGKYIILARDLAAFLEELPDA